MTIRPIQTTLTVAVLGLGGCIVAPVPMAVAQQNCQQYSQTIIVDGAPQMGYGVQCQQADGSWQIVTPASPVPANPPPAVIVAPYPAYAPYPYAPYAYTPYYYPSPWYFAPEIGIGIGVGRGWHGGRRR